MICIVAIIDTMLSTTIEPEHAIDDGTHAGSATAFYEDLQTLLKRTLQQIIWWRITYGLLWTWQQLTRSENCTHQIAELMQVITCGKDHQHKVCFDITNYFNQFFQVYRIKKRSRSWACIGTLGV